MHLEIGQTVHFMVRLEQQVDHLGQPRAADVFFVSNAAGYSPAASALPVSDGSEDRKLLTEP